MLKAIRMALMLFTIAMVTGCAFSAQTVVIEPTVEVTPSNMGEGHNVGVYVVDERTSTEIGRRGTGAMRGAAITTEQDIATVFSDAIVENLAAMGFEATAVMSPEASVSGTLLRVDIRSIEYETSMGFWTGGVHSRGAMKGTATREARSYDQLYRVDDEKRVMVVPGASKNSQLINTTVSALLQEMFNDVALFQFLAE